MTNPPKLCEQPGLTICSDPNDFSPGSCMRLNFARTLDAYEACRGWERMVVKVCKVPPRRSSTP